MSGGGGGRIIIRSRARELVGAEVVTENLTPAECAIRDAILAKVDCDWSGAELRKLFALASKADGRCK